MATTTIEVGTRPDTDGQAQPTPCCVLASTPLGAEEAARIAPMFKALGDPVRLRLVALIAAGTEACVCDLVGAFPLSAPTISHHLKVLPDAGLVTAQRRGTWVFYRVRPEVLALLSRLLGEARSPIELAAEAAEGTA